MGSMLRTTVPEAAVDEHSHAFAREHDIGSHGSALKTDWKVLSEP
jgi:hypothetical protein